MLLLGIVGLVWPAPWVGLAILGALAAATGDTWASEIGARSRTLPRLVTTGRTVPAGTNGGVTPVGLVASLAGGLVIGVVAMLVAPLAPLVGDPVPPPATANWQLVIGALAGGGGSLVDSVLGATLQGVRRCPRCRQETEAAVHHCGRVTVAHRGLPWLTNDGVNLLATIAGSLLAVSIGLLMTVAVDQAGRLD